MKGVFIMKEMNITPVGGNGWVVCLGICAVLCTADTLLPIGDAVGGAAGAARYA